MAVFPSTLFALWASALVSVVFAVPSPLAGQLPLHPAVHGESSLGKSFVPVPVALGVMSRCPDGMACEAVFDSVLSKIGHSKVDLKLAIVATRNASEPTWGVTCAHGPGECIGNIHELCAIRAAHSVSSSTTPKSTPASEYWWSFIQCLNTNPLGRTVIGGLDLSRKCARKAGLQWDGEGGIGECVGGPREEGGKWEGEGVELLRRSARWTGERGIRSCTVLINNVPVCRRDGEWKECPGGHEPEDFVRRIREEFARLNPGLDL